MPLRKIIKKGVAMNSGFPHAFTKIFAERCRVLIALGRIGIADIPKNKEELADLINGGVDSPWLPLGRLSASGSKVTGVPKTQEVDFGKFPTGVDVQIELNSIHFDEDMLEFVSELGVDEYSFMMVPDETDNVFYAVSGITLAPELSLPIVDGDSMATISFKGERKANKYTDVIYYKELIA